VTVTMALEIELVEGNRALDMPEWPQLLGRDPGASVFATPEWNRVWWEEFHDGKTALTLLMKRGDELAAIVPLYMKREDGRRVLRFNGGIDLTDYLGPICAPGDRFDVAEALVTWLEGYDDWDELDAHNMPVPSGFAEFLVERADRAGLRFRLDQEETAAVLTLPPDFDSYLASLGSKERHELKRKQRRFDRELAGAVFRTATADTLEEDLATFVSLHRDTEGDKGHFMSADVATFFERAARAFLPSGWLRLDFLEVEGRALATTFGFEIEGTFYLYNSAFESEARRLSPGLILVAKLIEGSIDRGFHTFDFLRGPERYKYQLGAQAVPLNNVRIFRRGASETAGG
jgi:CelD/BcsL family acetyltransferase involved in cellulose biosynthesis